MEKKDIEEEEKQSVKSSTRKGSGYNEEVHHPYTVTGGNAHSSLDFNECDANVFRKVSNERMDHVFMFLNYILLGLLVGAFGFGIRMLEYVTGKYGWAWPSDILHRDIDFDRPISSQNYFIAYVVFIVEAFIYVVISSSLIVFVSP